MRISTASLLLSAASFIAASPVPAIEWVTEINTITKTVGRGQDQGQQSQEATTPAATQAGTPTTEAAQPTVSTQENVQQNAQPTVQPSSSQLADTPTLGAGTETSTSSTATAPTSQQQAPTTSAATTSSPTAPSTTSDGSASSSEPSGSTQSGEGTYYDPDMGSCGEKSSADDLIVALSHSLYDEYTPNGNPNKNSLCGKKIRASYEGKSVDVKVVDRCVGCAKNDLDLSPAAFSKIADKDLGRIHLTWKWLD